MVILCKFYLNTTIRIMVKISSLLGCPPNPREQLFCRSQQLRDNGTDGRCSPPIFWAANSSVDFFSELRGTRTSLSKNSLLPVWVVAFILEVTKAGAQMPRWGRRGFTWPWAPGSLRSTVPTHRFCKLLRTPDNWHSGQHQKPQGSWSLPLLYRLIWEKTESQYSISGGPNSGQSQLLHNQTYPLQSSQSRGLFSRIQTQAVSEPGGWGALPSVLCPAFVVDTIPAGLLACIAHFCRSLLLG